MKSKNKSQIYLYLFGLFLTPLFSHPFANHINGKDSFLMYGISNDILISGDCSYLINFFSYLGLFPHSYSAAAPVFAAMISCITGINVESSTWHINIALFFLTFTSCYLLGNLVTRKNIGGFILGLSYTTSPIISSFIGNWNFSTRIMVIAFSPIIVTIFFKYFLRRDNRFFFLALFFISISLTFHRISYFLVAIFSIFLVTSFINSRFNRTSVVKFLEERKIQAFIFSHVFLFLLFTSPIFARRFLYLEGPEIVSNPSFKIFDSESLIALTINLVANYAMGFGLLFIFIIPGFYKIYYDFLLNPVYRFLLLFTLFSGFIWVELLYARLFLTILISIYVSIGVCSFIDKISNIGKKKLTVISSVGFLILIQFLPMLFVFHDQTEMLVHEGYNEEQTEDIISLSHRTPEETIDISNYLRYYGEETEMFSNYDSLDSQVRAFSGKGSTSSLFLTRDYQEYTFTLNFSNMVSIILGEKVSLGLVDGPSYDSLKYSVFLQSSTVSKEYLDKAIEYNVGPSNEYYFVVLVASAPNNLVWESEPSYFLLSLNEESYKIYENSLLSLMYYDI